MKKKYMIISILIVLMLGCLLAFLQHYRNYKTSPKYVLSLIGKNFSGDGKKDYYSALEEYFDSEAVGNEMFSRILLGCLAETKDANIRISAISDDLKDILDGLKGSASAYYYVSHKHIAKIGKIEYLKRRRNGELINFAIAPVEFKGGLVFNILLEKKDKTWLPIDLENKDKTVCKWVVSIEELKKKGIPFDKVKSVFSVAITGTNIDADALFETLIKEYGKNKSK